MSSSTPCHAGPASSLSTRTAESRTHTTSPSSRRNRYSISKRSPYASVSRSSLWTRSRSSGWISSTHVSGCSSHRSADRPVSCSIPGETYGEPMVPAIVGDVRQVRHHRELIDESAEALLRVLLLRDVEHHALIDRPSAPTDRDRDGLVADPHPIDRPWPQSILGPERRSPRRSLGPLGEGGVPIVGVHALFPQRWVGHPLRIREAEEPFDLGTDEGDRRGPRRVRRVPGVGHRGYVLDERSVASFGLSHAGWSRALPRFRRRAARTARTAERMSRQASSPSVVTNGLPSTHPRILWKSTNVTPMKKATRAIPEITIRSPWRARAPSGSIRFVRRFVHGRSRGLSTRQR